MYAMHMPHAFCESGVAEVEGPFWFTVKYGEGQIGHFNADCWAVVLLDYMKERCGYGDLAEPVELQRPDGSCVGLLELGKTQATDVLKPKEVCILCKVVAAAEDGSTPQTYESLWTPGEGEELPPEPAPPVGKKK